MSQENVDAVKRFIDAYNRRNVEAMLEELDPGVEWHPAILGPLEGEPTVYRGHEGVRQWVREQDEVFDEIHAEYSEIRDLGDQIVAIGHTRMRGKGSGAETESPLASVTDHANGKAVRIRSFFDPKEALKAAGLSE
jgi:ketosteroid isomerase-like protein